MNNSFITLLLETLGITEAQTIELSRIIDAWNLKPCITRDVLQPALKGEKIGDTLVPLLDVELIHVFICFDRIPQPFTDLIVVEVGPF